MKTSPLPTKVKNVWITASTNPSNLHFIIIIIVVFIVVVIVVIVIVVIVIVIISIILLLLFLLKGQAFSPSRLHNARLFYVRPTSLIPFGLYSNLFIGTLDPPIIS